MEQKILSIFHAFVVLALILVIISLLPAPTPGCTEEIVAEQKSDLNLTTGIDDPGNDLILDHPLYEQNFRVYYRDATEIPPELDIVSVNISREQERYWFRIRTAGNDLSRLFAEEQHSARFAVYVDTDHNGISDLFLTTTSIPNQGLVLSSTFRMLDEMPGIRIEGDTITLSVSDDRIGENYHWVAVAGYSVEQNAYFRTPFDNVFFVPVVDIGRPDGTGMIEELTLYSGSGQSCQVITSQYTTCPCGGNPSLVPVPGTSYQGVIIFQKQCGQIGYGLWCIEQSFFGKRVVNHASQGWIARCPFTYGYNEQTPQDTNQDGLPDRIYHSITDAGPNSASIHDQDGDTRLDIMKHEYLYQTDEVTSCNVERDYQTLAITDTRCLPARPPYPDPASVPGTIP